MEGESLAMYDAAGMDPALPRGAMALVHALLGSDCIVWGDTDGQPACYVAATGKLHLRRGLVGKRLAWALCHELAEWHLHQRRIPVDPELLERTANSIAARLLAPAPAVRAAVGVWGISPRKLADAFSLTQTAMALRLGEVLRRPVLVASRGRLWRAGGEQLELWPHLRSRQVAARIIRGARTPDWQRVTLTDAARVALFRRVA